ncbi:hypothetical protein Droror1_Dr00009400 [Drosera rotundifolia]
MQMNKHEKKQVFYWFVSAYSTTTHCQNPLRWRPLEFTQEVSGIPGGVSGGTWQTNYPVTRGRCSASFFLSLILKLLSINHIIRSGTKLWSQIRLKFRTRVLGVSTYWLASSEAFESR